MNSATYSRKEATELDRLTHAIDCDLDEDCMCEPDVQDRIVERVAYPTAPTTEGAR